MQHCVAIREDVVGEKLDLRVIDLADLETLLAVHHVYHFPMQVGKWHVGYEFVLRLVHVVVDVEQFLIDLLCLLLVFEVVEGLELLLLHLESLVYVS